MQQSPAGDHNIEGHDDGDQRIQNRQSGELGQGYPQHHPQGGPDITEQVMGIGPQGDRIKSPPGPQQQPGHPAVDCRGHQRKRQAHIHLLQPLWLLQAPGGGMDDRQGRHHNQGAFEATGEILRFGMAEMVTVIGRFGRQGEGPERPDGRHQIHPRFQGVG